MHKLWESLVQLHAFLLLELFFLRIKVASQAIIAKV